MAPFAVLALLAGPLQAASLMNSSTPPTCQDERAAVAAEYESRIKTLERDLENLRMLRFEPTDVALPGDIEGSWQVCRASYLKLGMHLAPVDLPVPVPEGCSASAMAERTIPSFEELYAALYNAPWGEDDNIFAEFSCGSQKSPNLSYPHSALRKEGSETRFQRVLEQLHPPRLPEFIVEVGTFHGGSAIFMAEFLDRHGARKIPILCVDPFTGDLNVWLNHHVWDHMGLTAGRPTIYEQFMSNVVGLHELGVSKTHILPFPVTSIVAARWLQLKGYSPDLIFLDSAHEVDETFMEIVLYWRILQPGGVLFGDDYRWPSVKMDADRFARSYNVKLFLLDEEMWYIPKPAVKLA